MTSRNSAVVLTLFAAAACGPKPEPVPAEGGPAVVFTEANWKAPTEADIPNDSMGASIKRALSAALHPRQSAGLRHLEPSLHHLSP